MKPTATYRNVLVSPAQAAEWLKRNRKNRPINHSHVERLKRDIECGRWVPSPQPIVFDVDGDLIDGQHRLTAIAAAGSQVWATVCEGAPREAIRSIDMGQSRRPDGILRMLYNVEPSKHQIAIANSMAQGISVSPLNATRQEQAEFYLEHMAAINWTVENLPPSAKHARRAPVNAAVARAYYRVDRDVLARFCKILCDGIVERAEDATVIVLRDFLMTSAGALGAGRSGQVVTYRKTTRAIDAFRKGEVLGKLYEARGDLFPLPVGGAVSTIAA